jgi:hypothetical protein
VTGPADLAALRAKYEEMLALREAHDRARTEPGYVEPDPRRALAALASRFPGALRELDTLPVDALRARLDELDDAARDATMTAPWMTAQTAFHELARGAVAAKRWLAGRRAITPAMQDDLRSRGGPAAAWADELAAIARPPRGRLLDLVFARVAAQLGLTVAEARALVFTSTE